MLVGRAGWTGKQESGSHAVCRPAGCVDSTTHGRNRHAGGERGIRESAVAQTI